MTMTNDELREALGVEPPSNFVEYINLLIYGEAGTGKTHFMGTADDDDRLRPLLIFDVEGGMTTLKERDGVDVITVRSMAEVEKKYNTLFKSVQDGKLYYKTIGIDSLTELADLDMRGVMKQAYQAKPETVNIDVPSPREWGIVRNHVRLITRAFKDLPCHTVFIAGLGVESPENMPTKYFPGFAGKLQREVPGFVDIVGYYSTKSDPGGNGVIRQLQVLGTNRVVAKDRTKVLVGKPGDPDYGFVVNPTMTSIWNQIEGVELEPETDNKESK